MEAKIDPADTGNLDGKDPLTAAEQSYATVTAYQATLQITYGRAHEIIRYFYKKPGFVRMEFVTPHKGAQLFYNPATGKVRLQPFGKSKLFGMTVRLDSPLVKSPSGHRVDDTDIGTLLNKVRQLQAQGTTTVRGEEELGGKATLLVEIEGESGVAVDRAHRFLLNLDATTMLPLQVRTFDISGEPLETVLMDDLQTDIDLDDRFFAP